MDGNNQYNPNNYNPNNYNPQQQQQQPYNNPYYSNRPIDPDSEPMTLKDWVITLLLLMIPIANIVLLFVWAFGSGVNKSKKTFCQAKLIMMLIGIFLTFLFYAFIISMFASIFSTLNY